MSNSKYVGGTPPEVGILLDDLATADTAALRDEGGRLKAQNPLTVLDLVNLQYANENYAPNVKNNLTATSAPTVGDDENDGYSIFSKWIDNSQSPVEVYICLGAQAGNAKWVLGSLTLEDLGTAATLDKATTQQALDGVSNVVPDAAGVHQAFNQYGLGLSSNVNYVADVIDTSLPAGFYTFTESSLNKPVDVVGDQYGTLIVQKRQDVNGQAVFIANTYNPEKMFFRIINTVGGVDTGWQEIFHTGNSVNPLDYGLGGEKETTGANADDLPLGSHTLNQWNVNGQGTAKTLNFPDLGIPDINPVGFVVDTFGHGTRTAQMAVEIFGQGGKPKGRTFERVKHDDSWVPWQEVATENSYLNPLKYGIGSSDLSASGGRNFLQNIDDATIPTGIYGFFNGDGSIGDLPFDGGSIFVSCYRNDSYVAQFALSNTNTGRQTAQRFYDSTGGWTEWQYTFDTNNNPASLVGNGYQKLASGMILQWGGATVDGDEVVNFPIAFPNGCFVVNAIGRDSSNPNNEIMVSVGGCTTTGVRVFAYGGTLISRNIYYMAIGY